jgi:predicted dehydrogenase
MNKLVSRNGSHAKDRLHAKDIMKNVLVIGGGSIGERHVRCFQGTSRANVSLCEVNDDVRDRVTSTYQLASSFRSFDDALEQPFDAAVVCTPAQLHISMAKTLADRGIDLLIEKPLSTSFDGIDELNAVIQSKRLSVSIAYVTRQHPALKAMKVAIDSGRFGKPVQIVYTGGQHFPFYRPAYRDIYYNKHETGGGAIQDALTHTMNSAEWLVGPVTKLAADAEHCVLEGVDVEDTAHLITRHKNVLGSYSLNQYQSTNEANMTVICEQGAARFEGHNCRWLSSAVHDQPWQVEDTFTLERDDLFVAQANAFLDQVEGKAAAACSLDEACQTLRVNLAALESVRTGAWVEL